MVYDFLYCNRFRETETICATVLDPETRGGRPLRTVSGGQDSFGANDGTSAKVKVASPARGYDTDDVGIGGLLELPIDDRVSFGPKTRTSNQCP